MIEAMKEMVDHAAVNEGADETAIAALHTPDAIYSTKLIDPNSKELIGQFSRVIHRFPGKGGDRVAWFAALPRIQDTVRDAAPLGEGMSLKNALYEQVFGGAKGEFALIPGRTEEESYDIKCMAELLAVQYLVKKGAIGPDIDVGAPDMETGAEDMVRMAEEYYHRTGDPFWLAAFTGKPIDHGGLLGRAEATGFGAIDVEEELSRLQGRNVEGMPFGIQGSGNVSEYYVRGAIDRLGLVLDSISDKHQAIRRKDGKGLRVGEDFIFDHATRGLGQINERTCEITDEPDRLLYSDRIRKLVLAGPGDVIGAHNVDLIQAVEVDSPANIGYDLFALKAMVKAGKRVTSDIHGNAAGVIISNKETSLNKSGETMTAEEVDAYRKALMVEGTQRVYAEADGMPSDFATAAYRLAVRELLERDRNPSPRRRELLAQYALAAA